MSTTIRKQKSGDQLAVGDWLAPGALMERPAEVMFAHAFQADADAVASGLVGSEDGRTVVQLIVRQQGSTGSWPELVSGTTLFDLATDEDLAPLREQAERTAEIAKLRALADAMEKFPWLPVPHSTMLVHLYGDEGMRTVLALAERYGLPVDRHLDDRTGVYVPIGMSTPLDVIAWHKEGRPAEPAPEPVELLASGLTKAADESRGPLAGTTPVVTYFSFGHAQTDPATSEGLLNKYVTVVAPTYEACREAMFASRFGNRWAFDYLAGTDRAAEWVSRWTEHEVIVAPSVGPADAERALVAAKMLLTGDEPVSEAR